jgi:hypothetical protein
LFFKNPEKAMTEAFRVLRPGGVVAVSIWCKVGWKPDVEEAMQSVQGAPRFPTTEELLRSHTSDPGYRDSKTIVETLSDFGFEGVAVAKRTGDSVLRDVDEYLLMNQAVLGLFTKSWTDEQKETFCRKASQAVEKYMLEKYAQGPISWNWGAFLATANKPLGYS